jgi:hypothetical protein
MWDYTFEAKTRTRTRFKACTGVNIDSNVTAGQTFMSERSGLNRVSRILGLMTHFRDKKSSAHQSQKPHEFSEHLVCSDKPMS